MVEDQLKSGGWPEMISEGLKTSSPWSILEKLFEAREKNPDDLKVRGYIEILRNRIVRELLESVQNLDATPRMTAEFLSDYGRFDLNAQEGYLISLIDGRLSMRKLLRLAPFDSFITLYYIAKLRAQRAVAI